ncbi:hypothetical protein [Microbacterium sp. PMB16]|uniref:hypothetical protein n=1 Tax=Microbacterium sp. PMB16 TaxID=3120157 RepID=UPI003F4BEC7C
MSTSFPRRLAPAVVLLLGILAAPACATPAPPKSDAATSPASDGHGVDAGAAAEVSAPALALVVADENGEITLLDLATEDRTVLAEARDGVESVESDGRLVYIAHGSGADTSVEVIDTARWTVPHGDHTHSFRGEPHRVGALDGEGEARVTAGAQRATVHFGDGELVTIAHDELDDGLDDAPRDAVDADGPVVPFAEHLLVATADATIEVADATGVTEPGSATPCAPATDADITRVGAVVTCAEGAVLFTREVGGAIEAETLPLPAGAPAPATLSGRADRPDLAGVAGDQGAWLLDVRERHWTLIPTDVPLLRASALGDDDSRTVAIDADGRVRVLAPDGTVLARTEPLLAASVADPALRARVQLVVDATHAYVTDPAGGAVIEIAIDDASVARTFSDLDPWLLRHVG